MMDGGQNDSDDCLFEEEDGHDHHDDYEHEDGEDDHHNHCHDHDDKPPEW